MPAIVLLLYYSCNYNIKAIRLWIAYSGFILYMFLVKVSAAALVAMSVIIAGYFLFIRSNKRSPLNHLLSYKNTVLVGMIISIIPVLVVGGELAFNLTSLFGKRTGFSGRDIIWSKSVVQIFRNFLFGYGFEDSAITWQKINQTHCHNIILELLYVGGIVGFALFCLALFCYRPNRITLGTKIFAIVIFAYYVVGSMDWLAYNPLPMSIFVFNYYLSNDGPMNMHLA